MNTHAIVSTAYRDTSDVNSIVSDTLEDREGADNHDPAVSAPCILSVAERPLTAV